MRTNLKDPLCCKKRILLQITKPSAGHRPGSPVAGQINAILKETTGTDYFRNRISGKYS